MLRQNRVIAEKQDVLDSYEEDAEVAKLDAEAARFADVVARVGAFHQALTLTLALTPTLTRTRTQARTLSRHAPRCLHD